jgi:hypothetical protein
MTAITIKHVLGCGLGGSVFVTTANAAPRSVPNHDQLSAQRNSDGSWQCYPYCPGGTYEGRPVEEWLDEGHQ